MATLLLLVKSKTVIGVALLCLGFIDTMVVDYIPNTVSGFLVAGGTFLAGAGLAHKIEKVIAAIKALMDVLKPKNP